MKEYVGIKPEKAQEQDCTSTKQPYISITSLCFAFTYVVYTDVGLLCGSGISFCCQSNLVPVLFRF